MPKGEHIHCCIHSERDGPVAIEMFRHHDTVLLHRGHDDFVFGLGFFAAPAGQENAYHCHAARRQQKNATVDEANFSGRHLPAFSNLTAT